MKKILIIGNARSGKTTFAEMLAKYLPNSETMETSRLLVEIVAEAEQISIEAVYANKERYRAELSKLGISLKKISHSVLVDHCLENCKPETEYLILDGVRTVEEYYAVKSNFDVIIMMKSVREINDSVTTIQNVLVDVEIFNNSTLKYLEVKAEAFSKSQWLV